MTHTSLLAVLALAALPSTPASNGSMPTTAPAGTPNTRYCLRVDPEPGSRIETIQCYTREQWADLGLDVDQEWAQNGVRVIG